MPVLYFYVNSMKMATVQNFEVIPYTFNVVCICK